MKGEYCVTGNIKPQILTVANIFIHSTLTPLMISTKVSTEKNCLFSSKGLMLLWLQMNMCKSSNYVEL